MLVAIATVVIGFMTASYSLYHFVTLHPPSTQLTSEVRYMLSGECYSMAVTTTFGVLALVGQLEGVPDYIQSCMRISMFVFTAYTTRRLAARTQMIEAALRNSQPDAK